MSTLDAGVVAFISLLKLKNWVNVIFSAIFTNFRRFSPIFGEKMAFYLKSNDTINL
jgi:hypothetical protein